MEQWIILVMAAAGLLVAASMLRRVLGAVIRYVIFLGLAAVIYRQQAGLTGWDWLDLMTARDVAAIAGIAFTFTTIIMTLLFRKSKIRMLVLPFVGTAMAFAASAVWRFWETPL